MTTRDPLKPDQRRKRPAWVFWLVVAGAGVLAVFGAWLGMVLLFVWDMRERDQPMAIAEARPVVSETLAKQHGMTLEPTDQLVEAHRTSAGMQGDGDYWYLFHLSRHRVEQLETELREAGRHVPPQADRAQLSVEDRDAAARRTPDDFQQTPIDRLPPRIRQALSTMPKSTLAHSYRCYDRLMTQIIFVDDYLYYQFSHY